jgi:hypothetical protein
MEESNEQSSRNMISPQSTESKKEETKKRYDEII